MISRSFFIASGLSVGLLQFWLWYAPASASLRCTQVVIVSSFPAKTYPILPAGVLSVGEASYTGSNHTFLNILEGTKNAEVESRSWKAIFLPTKFFNDLMPLSFLEKITA